MPINFLQLPKWYDVGLIKIVLSMHICLLLRMILYVELLEIQLWLKSLKHNDILPYSNLGDQWLLDLQHQSRHSTM